ncbi:uncharacterized protein MELLADRAFT_95682 [Melampsora larici-populina 98AG31]|uniref:Protein kinase domain-containing protein n=1 Tax=Melampsora larici-populina (strain 98AG31 / pathotype 3-4-7) TaxID=747676 RepID=F4SA83_MELLP|nr:uncharacterized protein MELLADRAFT_95682 [Melampsora larici-populina 98AG31]EGF98407.1 hypothetical protein MELLADRAFT_95682 [Melampsora larici-populina 98AG31]
MSSSDSHGFSRSHSIYSHGFSRSYSISELRGRIGRSPEYLQSLQGPVGTLNSEDYHYQTTLVNSLFSKVYQVKDQRTNVLYAAKQLWVVDAQNCVSAIPDICNEIDILAAINHPSIVNFEGFFSNDPYTTLIFEYAPGGDLKDLLTASDNISQSETVIYTTQLAEAIHYLHDQSIIHRDLKLKNILVFPNEVVKIADFGTATFLPECGYVSEVCGTPYIQPPEMLSGSTYSKPIDWWALGIVMYELLSNERPFVKLSYTGSDITNSDHQIAYHSSFGPDIFAVISLLLLRDPQERLTSLDALQQIEIFKK